MAWRFQASKFKNTTPRPPKKEDTIFDLPIGNLSSTNNGVQSSTKHLAFHIDGDGGKLGVLPLGTKGRRLRKDISVVCAHSEQVGDFSFMPFNADQLVTCSRDEKVKIWQIKSEAETSLQCEIDMGSGVLLEALKPHCTAANIIAFASTGSGFVVDIEKQCIALEVTGIIDKAQSLDWSEDGTLLAIGGNKGRQVSIYDSRAGSSPIQSLEMHQGMGREGRVLFCGNRLLSSGFTNKRVQEVRLVDTANWSTPIHTQEFISTTGVLMPFYDMDTKLIFLAGKGTNKLFISELQTRVPYLSSVFEMTLPEQSLGACLGSKRSVSVMEGEVDTFYQLTKSSVLPIPCIVPRRSYRDFHSDLYPETRSGEAGCTASEWLQGSNETPLMISLAPACVVTTKSLITPEERNIQILSQMIPSSVQTVDSIVPTATDTAEKANKIISGNDELSAEKENSHGQHSLIADGNSHVMSNFTTDNTEKDEHISSVYLRELSDFDGEKSIRKSVPVSNTTDASAQLKVLNNTNDATIRSFSTRIRPKSCVVGQIASKFRHVETLAGIKANNSVFTNLRNVNTRLPPEANGACASGKFVAVPLSGPAGIIGIYDVDVPCKLPDGVMDGLFNKAQVTDLHWNPFDDEQLAVGTDIGLINLWRVTKDDGIRNEMEPERVLKLGTEKVLCFQWHPLASDLMAIALSDSSIELWDSGINLGKKIRIISHEATVLSMAWSYDGKRLASIGRDFMLNIHEPQLGSDCLVAQKKVLECSRAGRVLYACDDRLIIIVGLTKSSGRQVQLYDSSSLSDIFTQHIDNGTQPLVPYYDFDSSVLFISGKGSRIINMYEVCYDSPYLLPLTPYMAPVIGQAIAFHNKKRCNVMAVEFQRAWRLSEKTLELLIFRVPRVKKDLFQSDLFPDALATWRAALSGEQWLAGNTKGPIFENLKPEGVGALALITAPTQRLAKRSDFSELEIKDGEPSKQQVEHSWSAKIAKDTQVEQNQLEDESVTEQEWAS